LKQRFDQVAWCFVLLLSLACCQKAPQDAGETGAVTAPSVRIKLATTTSTDNSGLLAVLLHPFEEKTGIKVDVIAVGTGRALKLGETGDVDAVLVHARSSEEAFVKAGFGVNRREVMHNDFVLLGPQSDPAGIKVCLRATDALKAVAGAKAPFASRGDDSGTHKKEMALWRSAGVEPAGGWYMETGQGMGTTLVVADEKRAYVLADRGTYIALKSKLELEVCFEGDPLLFNPYGIMAVNPARHAHAKYREAMKLIIWVTSAEGQGIIGAYRKGGERLFHPDAITGKD